MTLRNFAASIADSDRRMIAPRLSVQAILDSAADGRALAHVEATAAIRGRIGRSVR